MSCVECGMKAGDGENICETSGKSTSRSFVIKLAIAVTVLIAVSVVGWFGWSAYDSSRKKKQEALLREKERERQEVFEKQYEQAKRILEDWDHLDCKDFAKAVKLLTPAAENGHAEAQFGLGSCYDGMRRALSFMLEDNTRPNLRFSDFMSDFMKEKMKDDNLVKTLTDANGNIFGYGYQWAAGAKWFDESAKWYLKAAQTGMKAPFDYAAPSEIAKCYRFGRGMPKDQDKADSWYKEPRDDHVEDSGGMPRDKEKQMENEQEMVLDVEILGTGESSEQEEFLEEELLSPPDAKSPMEDIDREVAWPTEVPMVTAGDAEREMKLREFVMSEKNLGLRTAAQLKLADIQQRRGFATFDAADATNDVVAAEAMRKKAYGSVVGSIKDFRGVAADLAKALETEGKTLDEKVRDQYVLRREQAIFLEGNSWQRLMRHVEEKNLPKIRAFAIKAFEKYLEAYPKGKYATQTLVKLGTIYIAESKRAADGNDAQLSAECMKKSQEAFARLQREFPNSDEAKNTVPRLAKTLIEMGLNSEGVAEYKKMLETTGGKYTAGQFLMAGDALFEAKSWMVAGDAYAKVAELAGQMTNSAAYLAPTLIGQAKAAKGAKNYAEARQKLDEFIEKYSKYSLATNAYDMLVDVALEIGRSETDDTLRMQAFNTAFGSLRKLCCYKKNALKRAEAELAKIKGGTAGQTEGADAHLSAKIAQIRKLQGELDLLALRRCKALLTKLWTEEAMHLSDEAEKTRRRAAVALMGCLMKLDPLTFKHGERKFKQKVAAKEGRGKQSSKEQEELFTSEEYKNLEFCYGELILLMRDLRLEGRDIEPYVDRYMELFDSSGVIGRGEHWGIVTDIRDRLKGN